jgi:hypothetical protein
MSKTKVHAAERMTVDEAGTATADRAIQLQGAAVALLAQQSAKLSDWDQTLDSWAENRPWLFLPDDIKVKYGKWDLWTAATLRINGDPLTRDRLIALLTGLYGKNTEAIKRVRAFEAAIEQPFNPGQGKRTDRLHYPDNEVTPRKARQGTDAGYLMGRMLQMDSDIADKIGKGKEYRSINAAAQALGITPARTRYEISPEVNLNNAAHRLVEVLGRQKAAELAAVITHLLTQP